MEKKTKPDDDEDAVQPIQVTPTPEARSYPALPLQRHDDNVNSLNLPFQKMSLVPSLTPYPQKSLATEQKSLKVLVVDDGQLQRHLLRRFLGNTVVVGSLEIHEAVDGFDGLGTICEHARRGTPFHLVLTDIDMPRLSGSSMVRALPIEVRSKSHIVAVTGMDNVNSIREYFDDVVCKPTTKSKICSVVTKMPPKRTLASRVHRSQSYPSYHFSSQ